MKATIDFPNELYRRVKAKSAMQGRAIRDVTMGLFQHWLTQGTVPATRRTPEAWLEARSAVFATTPAMKTAAAPAPSIARSTRS